MPKRRTSFLTLKRAERLTRAQIDHLLAGGSLAADDGTKMFLDKKVIARQLGPTLGYHGAVGGWIYMTRKDGKRTDEYPQCQGWDTFFDNHYGSIRAELYKRAKKDGS